MFSNSNKGVLNVYGTSTATTGTSEETLASYSLPANALCRDGQSVRIRAWGTTAANGNDKTEKLYFGSTTLISTGALAANAKDWYLEATVVRTGAATQTAVANGQANAAIVATDVTAPTEDLTAAVTIALKATDGTAAGGSILKGFSVEMGQSA